MACKISRISRTCKCSTSHGKHFPIGGSPCAQNFGHSTPCGVDLEDRDVTVKLVDDIDIVAGDGCEVDPLSLIDEIVIEDTTAKSLTVRVSGESTVTLRYSADDDAAEIRDDFPFWMRFSAPVETPRDLRQLEHEIDNSGWFGDDETD